VCGVPGPPREVVHAISGDKTVQFLGSRTRACETLPTTTLGATPEWLRRSARHQRARFLPAILSRHSETSDTRSDWRVVDSSSETQSASDKIAQLWERLRAAQLPTGSPQWPSVYSVFRAITDGDGYEEILRSRDDFREKEKQLCAVGMVALAEIEWAFDRRATGWTGLFAQPTTGVGILRCSAATEPPFARGSGMLRLLPSALRASLGLGAGQHLREASLFPCVALKFARSGSTPSANLLFAGRKVGQKEELFFASCLATAVTEKVTTMLAPFLQVLRRHSTYPTHLGVSDVAAAGSDGEWVDAALRRFPWCLALVPTAEAREAAGRSCAEGPAAFLEQLDGLEVGTPLYDVFAAAMPEACDEAYAIDQQKGLLHVGRLVLRSPFVRSAADAELAFWHQLKEEDYALRPEWAAAHKTRCKTAGAGLFARLVADGRYVPSPSACAIKTTP
jgi:hypothetical protein